MKFQRITALLLAGCLCLTLIGCGNRSGGAYTMIETLTEGQYAIGFRNGDPAAEYVQAALKVLKGFEGRRIIITPGMVELGAGEEQFNHDFGTMMADCVDVAILVGKKHTAPIAKGLREAGFPENNLHVVSTLDDASALLRQMGRPGDVALFENDLPDHYSEA